MLPQPVSDALSILTAALDARPELRDALLLRWRSEALRGWGDLDPQLRTAADLLLADLPELTRSNEGTDALAALFAEPAGNVVLTWCTACTHRRDVVLAPLVFAAANAGHHERAQLAGRERVVEGPLLDALVCAPLLGGGGELAAEINAEARSRLQILIWEAGATALEVP
ncbi:MAG: hypothetical protein ABI193_09285, partial [Minicystis sp.]